MIELNRIYNEDCLIGMGRIPDKSVDMILCDLPYGTTACKWDVVIPFEPLWEQYERIIKDNGAIILFGSEPFSSRLRLSNIEWYRYDWIWDKVVAGGGLLANKQPLRQHENIMIFYKKQPTYNKQMTEPTNPNFFNTMGKNSNFGEIYSKTQSKRGSEKRKNPTTIIAVNKFQQECNSANRLHPTQKPVALFEYLIKTYTNEGDTVLDNCMGSGTTAIACINTNRNYIGFELDKHYCDIANERIQRAVQDKATSEKGL
jgi:DNA modification methylase